MSINYSLVTEDEVSKVTATTVVDLGEKAQVIAMLEASKASYQAIIDSHIAQIAEVQDKLDAINAL